MRLLCLNKIEFDDANFLMESVLDPWGEDDSILEQSLLGKFDENQTLGYWSYLASLGSRGDLVLDVGAYAGLFALVATRQNPHLKAAAFEASSVTYGRLVRNIILNHLETRVCAVHVAVWSEKTKLEFTHRYGIYSMCPGDSANFGGAIDHTESVLTMPLDVLLASNRDEIPGALGSKTLGVRDFKSITAIKIDVEGAEINVLRGAKEILRLHKPYILCELLSEAAVIAVNEFLIEYEYVVRRIGDERNYLLSPKSKLAEFELGSQHWLQTRASPPTLTASRLSTFSVG